MYHRAQTAASLLSFILSFLKELNLDNIPIIAQSYDGVSVMSGCRGDCGLHSIYMAHRLNLVVVDMCRNVKVYTILCIIYLCIYYKI